ncbi:DUF1033 family protein [Sporosarcina sp. PTS2304]|uniref:DUF1033 family protein n=1 Tax=Sporosarcina sp. PTS2304 TaxID=2283194 RepID=UPI000E0D4C91|nr:DUF1033 family protein [Sporosarcina sp. PTS2304]AXH99193.1 DUF1033 family protein [Sporosarcina sp. PTS2304]
MYEVVYMKADFEPWWMFEEWREYSVTSKTFTDSQSMQEHLQQLIEEMLPQFDYYEHRKGCFHAFWSDSEKHYCEGCEGDSQIYHGIIVLFNDRPNLS